MHESWSEFHNKLKHKKGDLIIDELVNTLKIEDANCLPDNNVKANIN